MVYPVVVVMVAVGIWTFVAQIKIVPAFEKIFDFANLDDDQSSDWAFPRGLRLMGDSCIPISIWLFVKPLRKFRYGREGWDTFSIKVPIFGQLVEKTSC